MEMPEIDPEMVVKFLTRTELGATMWRAATAEALSEALAQRLEQMQQQQEAQRAEDKPADG